PGTTIFESTTFSCNSTGCDLKRFDDVTHVTSRVPQRFEGLGLPNSIRRFHPEQVFSHPFRNEGNRPSSERIFSKVFSQFRFPPGASIILGKQNLLDAVATIESNATHGRLAPHADLRAICQAR